MASKALRGPFRKLIRQLELTLRKPIIKRFGPVGRRIDSRLYAKDSEAAFSGARQELAAMRASGTRVTAGTSAAVDRRTGKVVGIGHARDDPPIPGPRKAVLPTKSLEKWSVTNCAEVAAAVQAIERGSKLEDLVIRTVRSSGVPFHPCKNCIQWIPGEA